VQVSSFRYRYRGSSPKLSGKFSPYITPSDEQIILSLPSSASIQTLTRPFSLNFGREFTIFTALASTFFRIAAAFANRKSTSTSRLHSDWSTSRHRGSSKISQSASRCGKSQGEGRCTNVTFWILVEVMEERTFASWVPRCIACISNSRSS